MSFSALAAQSTVRLPLGRHVTGFFGCRLARTALQPRVPQPSGGRVIAQR